MGIHEKDAELGRRLKMIRNYRGVTQKELASKVGVSYQQIQKYETATNRLSISKLYEIAEAIEASVLDFLPTQTHTIRFHISQENR